MLISLVAPLVIVVITSLMRNPVKNVIASTTMVNARLGNPVVHHVTVDDAPIYRFIARRTGAVLQSAGIIRVFKEGNARGRNSVSRWRRRGRLRAVETCTDHSDLSRDPRVV
jgi:hypothetical protein